LHKHEDAAGVETLAAAEKARSEKTADVSEAASRAAACKAPGRLGRLSRRALRACIAAAPACAPGQRARLSRSAALNEGPSRNASAPRPQAALKAQLESIRVVIHEAKFSRSEQRQCGALPRLLRSLFQNAR
jgi:hypothetical protein